MNPFCLTGSALCAPGIAHGFFGRQGGVSEGLYASLNAGLGSGDDPKAVLANRSRAAVALGLNSDALCTPYQVHGADVARVLANAPPDRPRCDGLVTTESGIGLAILTADCAPILLVDAQRRVIGAAHAGWKGLIAGILPAIVAEMERAGGARGRIRAAIGPCIGQSSYEVGPEFVERFVSLEPLFMRFFRPGEADRSHFDLSACCAAQLEALGLAQVEQVHADTCALDAQFFSNRRALQQGQPDYGRNISIIALVNELQ